MGDARAPPMKAESIIIKEEKGFAYAEFCVPLCGLRSGFDSLIPGADNTNEHIRVPEFADEIVADKALPLTATSVGMVFTRNATATKNQFNISQSTGFVLACKTRSDGEK